MDLLEHQRRLRIQSEAFASELDRAYSNDRLAAPVPTCPDWTVHDLALHLGGIFRWVTWLVANSVATETWRSDLDIEYPAAGSDLVSWFRASLDPMMDALDAAPPSRRVFAWGVDPHARFWPRRLHHECNVHLVDLRLAVRDETSPVSAVEVGAEAIDGPAAVDALDELLTNLPATARWGAPIDLLRGNGESLRLDAAEEGESWRVRFEPTGFWWDRSAADADVTLGGSATALLLFLLNRPAEVAMTGDTSVFEQRRAALAF